MEFYLDSRFSGVTIDVLTGIDNTQIAHVNHTLIDFSQSPPTK